MKSRKTTATPKAVALMYDAGRDSAPRVAAKGSGELAKKILELAREHNIPVRSDPDLIEMLSKIDVLDEIPADLYTAVAQILAFLYDVNRYKLSTISPDWSDNAERNLYGIPGDDTPADETRGDGQ